MAGELGKAQVVADHAGYRSHRSLHHARRIGAGPALASLAGGREQQALAVRAQEAGRAEEVQLVEGFSPSPPGADPTTTSSHAAAASCIATRADSLAARTSGEKRGRKEVVHFSGSRRRRAPARAACSNPAGRRAGCAPRRRDGRRRGRRQRWRDGLRQAWTASRARRILLRFRRGFRLRRGPRAGEPQRREIEWGRSSVGRASRSQCEGRGFESLRLHHPRSPET